MRTSVDTSNDWTVEQETIGAHNDREKIQVTNTGTGVSIVAKEQPNGAELQLRIPADKPGGYDVVHNETFVGGWIGTSIDDTPLTDAVSELERYAAMYDTEGTWLIEGTPVLHN